MHHFTVNPKGLMTCFVIMSNNIRRMEFSHYTGRDKRRLLGTWAGYTSPPMSWLTQSSGKM